MKSLERSLAIRRDVLGEDHAEVAASLSAMGACLSHMHQYVCA